MVPRQVLDGLLTALHLKLDHPSRHQMKMVVRRYFFALDMDKHIDSVCDGCHHLAALLNTPHTLIEQTTSDPPGVIGTSFAADVLKGNRQLVLVVRECVTSYTLGMLIDNERRDTLRDALIRLCIEMRPLNGPPAVIRTDPAPGCWSLLNDELLHQHRLSLEIGRVKNPNKNPVAEKAVQELENELCKQEPHGGPISPMTLSVAIARLNSRIRSRGLSAREMWTQRDQFSNSQIFVDRYLIMTQHKTRVMNHPYSELSKAHLSKRGTDTALTVGDLVHLHTDRNKSYARHRNLVASVDGNWCNVRKFVGAQLRSSSYRVKLVIGMLQGSCLFH